jgi:hypothetical protein
VSLRFHVASCRNPMDCTWLFTGEPRGSSPRSRPVRSPVGAGSASVRPVSSPSRGLDNLTAILTAATGRSTTATVAMVAAQTGRFRNFFMLHPPRRHRFLPSGGVSCASLTAASGEGNVRRVFTGRCGNHHENVPHRRKNIKSIFGNPLPGQGSDPFVFHLKTGAQFSIY